MDSDLEDDELIYSTPLDWWSEPIPSQDGHVLQLLKAVYGMVQAARQHLKGCTPEMSLEISEYIYDILDILRYLKIPISCLECSDLIPRRC